MNVRGPFTVDRTTSGNKKTTSSLAASSYPHLYGQLPCRIHWVLVQIPVTRNARTLNARLRNWRLTSRPHATASASATSHRSSSVRSTLDLLMLSRGPHDGGSAEEKWLASSSDTLLRPDSNHRKLTAGYRQSHVVARTPKTRWQNKYLFPGTAVLTIYGAMRLWFHVPFALLYATLVTKPVTGQCPSYTEYSKVAISEVLVCARHRHNIPRTLMERRRGVHWVSHICDQTPLAGPSQAPWWK